MEAQILVIPEMVAMASWVRATGKLKTACQGIGINSKEQVLGRAITISMRDSKRREKLTQTMEMERKSRCGRQAGRLPVLYFTCPSPPQGKLAGWEHGLCWVALLGSSIKLEDELPRYDFPLIIIIGAVLGEERNMHKS